VRFVPYIRPNSTIDLRLRIFCEPQRTQRKRRGRGREEEEKRKGENLGGFSIAIAHHPIRTVGAKHSGEKS